MKLQASIQSQGGSARAAKLTKEKRSEIAARGALARWSKDLPMATHEGTLNLGETISLPCAVLEDGTRVLSRAEFVRAIGRRGKVKGGEQYEPESKLPVFLGADNLAPFIPNALRENSTPVRFRTRGTLAFGYRAEMLPAVCDVFLAAREAGALKDNQLHIARQCEILVRALASVGITALVDEATGYQYDRARDALAVILEKFIAKELRPWTRTFPLEFYEQIFRLNGWKFDPATMQGPRCLSQMTNDVVYDRLAHGVREELQRKNPVIDGRRKHKHHQWLTGEVGHPKLLAHLEGVKILMMTSNSWSEFHEKLEKFYPIKEKTELGLEVTRSRKPKPLLLING